MVVPTAVLTARMAILPAGVLGSNIFVVESLSAICIAANARPRAFTDEAVGQIGMLPASQAAPVRPLID